MIGPKFEVGKEYVCTSGLRAICRYAYENNGYNCMVGEVTVAKNGFCKGIQTTFSGSAWKEYHEPKVDKFKKLVIAYGLAEDGYVVNKLPMSGLNTIGSVEFIVTDGKLTDVRIVS